MDEIKSPPWYVLPRGLADPEGYECDYVIRALEVEGEFNFRLASAFKYIWRAGRKPGVDKITDLRKAHEQLGREIARLLADEGVHDSRLRMTTDEA